MLKPGRGRRGERREIQGSLEEERNAGEGGRRRERGIEREGGGKGKHTRHAGKEKRAEVQIPGIQTLARFGTKARWNSIKECWKTIWE